MKLKPKSSQVRTGFIVNVSPYGTKMKVHCLFLIFAFLFTCSCQEKLPSTEKPELSYQLIDSLEKVIENAYLDSNINALNELLLDFSKRYIPLDSAKIESQIEKDIYSIFQLVYKPNKLDYLSDSTFKSTYYEKTDFYIVQSKIKYLLENGENKEWQYDSMPTIWNFRPKLDSNIKKQIVFLTAELDSAINRFLDYQDIPVGENNIMNPSIPILETERRFNFLSNTIIINYGHWGGYWHLETHPEINVIQFSQKRDYAYVSYRIQYSFWFAEVYKKNGNWILKKIEHIGVE